MDEDCPFQSALVLGPECVLQYDKKLSGNLHLAPEQDPVVSVELLVCRLQEDLI